MTDRRGPLAQAEDRSDLTPAEARAEVEAWLGEGWITDAVQFPDGNKQLHAERGPVRLDVRTRTHRAAVAALKQAWRDAVRPWMEAAIEAKLDTADVDGYAPTERVIDRVCEKGMSNG